MPVVECDVEAARERLADAGATVGPGNTEHERWRAELGDAVAVAYDDKVVVQGSRPTDIEAVLREGRGGPRAPDGASGNRPRVGGRAHVYFDGASRGNPGPAAIGWVVVTDDGIVAQAGERIGRATNNQAEYEALIRGLEVADDLGFEEVRVRGDSELVVEQVRGAWRADDPELRERRVRVHELLDRFDEWSIQHVPREINERADELATEAFEDG